MIYEHEIPKGSRLYFGQSAKLKRKIEYIASEVLDAEGFEEIVTPYLSYHQHKYIPEEELLRFSDLQNHLIALRSDSTLDVVRIATKRLGRTTEQKKWFYIQPVFRYPSSEMYQIGGEILKEDNLEISLNLTKKIFDALEVNPLLQISNIAIPRILSKMLSLPLEVFENANIEVLLNENKPWLSALATLQYPEQISEVLDMVPEELKKPLNQIWDLAKTYKNEKIIIAPLYYAKMRYYEDLFFRFVGNNKTLGLGGCYELDGVRSSGFGIYTDRVIKLKQDKK